PLVDHLRCRREELQPGIIELMDRLARDSPLLELYEELEGAEWDGDASALRSCAYGHASVAVEELLEHAGSVPIFEDWQGHHALRIAGKRLRYNLEAFREAYDDGLREELKAMKGLQDVVGELHDCDVWLQRIPRMREEVPSAREALGHLQREMEGRRRRLHAGLVEVWCGLEQERFFSRLLERMKGPEEEMCPMRVALISDVHGNAAALRAVLLHARERGCSSFLHAGDAVGLPRPEEAIALLRGADVLSVLGNMDQEALDLRAGRGCGDRHLELSVERLGEGSWDWLSSLPEEVRLDLCGRTLYMTHAVPGGWDEKLLPSTPESRYLELARELGADLVVTGHSHIPMVRKVSRTLFVNPGSVGRPRDGPRAAYALVALPSLKVTAYRVEYDAQGTAGEIASLGLEDLSAEVAGGRDQGPMVVLERWAVTMHQDREHAEQVRRLALQLFDHTKSLHHMGEKERVMLEMAALVHDVGLCEGPDGHQRRALDLIMGAELPLEDRKRRMVACVARYHGCRPPRGGDRVFRDLREKDKQRVRMLSSLLAIADALDRAHDSKVSNLTVKVGRKEVQVSLTGRGPFPLEEEWVGCKQCQFEKVFGRRVRIVH
ncbi:MAG: metallophosphoesterase family protein, partial [Methanomassiliicoccales archaeon]|nr:metallophosphoesterase family protein [Methanomassiliicoccales archaeon]